jgi:hypothetical protein
MKSMARALTSFGLASLIYVAWPRPALAYIDPGTGSYLIQLLIAAAVGLAFGVKLYWRKIKTLFSRHTDEEAQEARSDD